MKRIHIVWKGPFSVEQFVDDNDQIAGVGLYQIYGLHPINGYSLLYIGKTISSFKKRLLEEKWHYSDNSSNIQYYLGSIAALSVNEELSSLIDISEKLLILSHAPSYNSSNVKAVSDDIDDYQIYNWGSYNRLLPEISGDRYSSKYWIDEKNDWAIRYQ